MKSLSLALLAAIVMTAAPVLALEKPTGDPVLTIRGAVSQTNEDGAAVFDMAMLDALKHRQARMETPWTKGEIEFSGPLLREVLKAAGARGTALKVVAINDYASEVPMEDADTLDTMLASKIDGKAMSIRDKGPLMLVYPFDLDKNLYNEKYFSRSVWQIKEIEVLP